MGDHYLPQVLLKGFASAGSNGMKTFLFRSGADPKLVSIRKVAQERSFHGRRDQSDLESRMSELESQYAPAIRAAWVGECGKYVQELSRFVANISARTRNVREGVSGAVEVMLSAAPDALSTDKHLKKIRNQARKTAMRNLREKFPTLSPRLIRQKVDLLLKHEMGKKDMSKFIKTGVQQVVSQLDVPKMTMKAHNQALGNTFKDTERVELLKSFSWAVDLRAEPTWILGDVGCIAKLFNSETLCNVLMAGKEELEAVCLPISDKALLIGRRPQSRYQPDAKRVNQASAGLSQHFFVASVLTDGERALKHLIGHRSRLMSDDELKRIMQS
jgi:hypothetical protein